MRIVRASLVVIDQFNIGCVPFDKAKDHPPVRSDRDSIEPLPVPFQEMQSKAGQIHIARLGRTVEHRKDIFDLLTEVCPDTFALPILKQPFQPLVLKIDNHGSTLLCQLTIVNCLINRTRNIRLTGHKDGEHRKISRCPTCSRPVHFLAKLDYAQPN